MFSILNIPKNISDVTIKQESNQISLLSIKQRQQLLKYLEHKKINSSK
jgi:hypothetical protein